MFLYRAASDAERERLLREGLQHHVFGRYLLRINRAFVANALAAAPMADCLYLGAALPQWPEMRSGVRTLFQAAVLPPDAPQPDVVAAYDALPWAAQSMDVVCWPHGLDVCGQTRAAVQALSRVVVPGGRVVLTGLNANGYWRLRYGRCAWLRPMRCRTAHDVVKWFREYGFTVVRARFLGYRLHTGQWSDQAAVELMGNRWWPHWAAMYGLVLVKQDTVLTPLRPQRLRGLSGSRLSCGTAAGMSERR